MFEPAQPEAIATDSRSNAKEQNEKEPTRSKPAHGWTTWRRSWIRVDVIVLPRENARMLVRSILEKFSLLVVVTKQHY